MGIKVREKVPGSGVFWVFVNWRGRRRAKMIGARETAEAVAARLRERLALGDESALDRPRGASRETFSRIADRWLEWYPGINAIRPATLENHRKFLRAHLRPTFGHLQIADVTRRRIQEFIAALRATGGSRSGKAMADSTIKTSLPTLRLILDYAVEEGLVPVNPMTTGPRLWRSAPRPEHVDPFTGRELRAILEAAEGINPDFGTMLRLWVQSGARAGEVRALTRGDVDLEGGLVNVAKTRTRKRLGPTKTGRTRLVSFLHPVVDDVAAWEPGATPGSRSVLLGLQRRAVTTMDPAGLLFSINGRPIDEEVLYRLWNRTLIRAQVRHREPEQLRHTWASILLSRNAPLIYVSAQGGWKSAGVLLQHYARWLPQTAPLRLPATQVQPRNNHAS